MLRVSPQHISNKSPSTISNLETHQQNPTLIKNPIICLTIIKITTHIIPTIYQQHPPVAQVSPTNAPASISANAATPNRRNAPTISVNAATPNSRNAATWNSRRTCWSFKLNDVSWGMHVPFFQVIQTYSLQTCESYKLASHTNLRVIQTYTVYKLAI